MRCVFDTNILVSTAISGPSVPRAAFDFARSNRTILLSQSVLAELENVFRRKRLQKYVTVQTGLKFLELLRINAEWVDVGHVRIKACRDPKDDMFLELAVAGKATHIISGDLDLLVMDPYQEIRILSPRNFLYQAFELRP